VGRKTQGERMRKKLKVLSGRLAAVRTLGGKAMLEYVRRHLQGHIQYFGVSGNMRSLKQHGYQVARLLYKWLNRRSQRRSVAWDHFLQVVAPRLPRPRIVHNLYPTHRG
jgi:RNA-directed DNA polymerase